MLGVLSGTPPHPSTKFPRNTLMSRTGPRAMEALAARLRPASAQEDHFTVTRRNNKRLIIAFFVLIFFVAVITGRIIVFLVRQHNLESQLNSLSFKQKAAIAEYCYSHVNCMDLLPRSINFTNESTPTQILRPSLKVAVQRISNLLTGMQGRTGSSINPRFEPTVQNCSSLLRGSVDQLNSTVDTMGSDPDEETRAAVFKGVTTVSNDLNQCLEALESVLSTAVWPEVAPLYLIKDEVYDARSLVGYGSNFLLNFNMVNENFYVSIQRLGDERWSRIVEDLSTVTLFGAYYFVLVFLFCLLLRIY